jgi:hypothetical protein
VLVRPSAQIKVRPFDGSQLPSGDSSFDTVVFADVLHHTEDPTILLKEGRRVAPKSVIFERSHDGRTIGTRDAPLHGLGWKCPITAYRCLTIIGPSGDGIKLLRRSDYSSLTRSPGSLFILFRPPDLWPWPPPYRCTSTSLRKSAYVVSPLFVMRAKGVQHSSIYATRY